MMPDWWEDVVVVKGKTTGTLPVGLVYGSLRRSMVQNQSTTKRRHLGLGIVYVHYSLAPSTEVRRKSEMIAAVVTADDVGATI